MNAEGRPHAGRMEGHGYYSAHSQAQQAYGALGFQWLEEAAAAVPAAGDRPFVVADLGAAGGASSLEPVRRALAARRGDGPALVVHTDIPSNDFSALFELVESAPGTYLAAPDVFALAAGRSFFERLLPDGFLSIGWCSIAVHWLSAVPAPIENHIYCSFAEGEARRALRARSARDWRAFLDHRAHELCRGGRLVVVGGAADDDGSSGAEGLMNAADASLRELVDGGIVTDAEYRAMTIPTWNRTLAEFAEPFDAGELAGRLELRRRALRWLPDRYLERYERDRDLDAYLEAVVDFFRAAFEESLLAGLDTARSDADRARVGDGLRARLREHVAADPASAACRWRVAVLDIARP